MSTAHTSTPLLTAEVARMAGVTPDTVRLWERRGLISAIRTGGGWRLFAREDVERLVQARSCAGSSSRARA